MSSDDGTTFETMSQADLEPVLALMQGGEPAAIARKAGISTKRLFSIRDDLLAAIARERAKAIAASSQKVGRNDPCPCGSGKKYKHCCLNLQPTPHPHGSSAQRAPDSRKTTENAQLTTGIEKAFHLLRHGHVRQAIDRANRLIEKYPNEDRLYDIVSTGHLYAGQWDAAIDICKRRRDVADQEKAYFIANGRYRDAGIEPAVPSFYYPPTTWLQKTWTALKAKDYGRLYPSTENAGIAGWIRKLQTADDRRRFPQTRAEGLDLRRKALDKTLRKLKSVGPEVIPYLLPLTVKYSWTGLLVPEILSVYTTEQSTRHLIDISMFGFAYASGACLHYLEKRGDAVIPAIEKAFSTDADFDPIKTGIVSVLGNLRTPAAYRLLLELIDHDSPDIVNWAGEALGKYDRIDVLPILTAARDRIGGAPMIDSAIFRLQDIAAGS